MTNVIGPITRTHWNTMLLLKRSIQHYKDQRDPIYDTAIKKETCFLKEYIEDALKNRAA